VNNVAALAADGEKWKDFVDDANTSTSINLPARGGEI
jgi:hypothetical protein